MFPPRAAVTLMVSWTRQQVQGLFSSGFHDASHGHAPRHCCPCSELLTHFSLSRTRICAQEVLLFLSPVRSTEDNCPLLGLGENKSAGQIRYIIHVGGGSILNRRWLSFLLQETLPDSHLKIWARRRALVCLEKLGDLKQESAKPFYGFYVPTVKPPDTKSHSEAFWNKIYFFLKRSFQVWQTFPALMSWVPRVHPSLQKWMTNIFPSLLCNGKLLHVVSSTQVTDNIDPTP